MWKRKDSRRVNRYDRTEQEEDDEVGFIKKEVRDRRESK